VGIFKKHWPVIIPLVALWATVAVLLVLSVGQNRGHLVYALDDPYIHMAMAKNMARHGVWGVDKTGFSSSSSSPLWTLLLSAVFFLFTVNEISPFVLNIIWGTLLLLAVYHLLSRYAINSTFIFITVLAIAYLAPLPRLIFLGQEHIMHTLIALFFAYFSARILSDEKTTLKSYMLLMTLAALVSLARYEGLFLIFAVCLLFLLRKRVLHALLLGGVGLLPTVIYGILSISKGWYFLPNPVLVKGNVPLVSSSFSAAGLFTFFVSSLCRAGNQLVINPHVLSLILGALIVFALRWRKSEGMWARDGIMGAIFIMATLLHMLFARVDGSFRYEAYLVALGLFTVVVQAREYLTSGVSQTMSGGQFGKYLLSTFLVLLFLVPLEARARKALRTTPRATPNIYQQQYQMGVFLREFYQGQGIAANDIGAINYLADIRCVDLFGLGDREPVRLVKEGTYGRQQIFNFVKRNGVKIAVIYERWYQRFGGLPRQWQKVGTWGISDNLVCAEDEVAFYAVDPAEAAYLNKNLRVFSSRVPEDVVQVVAKP